MVLSYRPGTFQWTNGWVSLHLGWQSPQQPRQSHPTSWERRHDREYIWVGEPRPRPVVKMTTQACFGMSLTTELYWVSGGWPSQTGEALQEEILFCHKQAQLTLAENCMPCPCTFHIGGGVGERRRAMLQKWGSEDRWASMEAHADQCSMSHSKSARPSGEGCEDQPGSGAGKGEFLLGISFMWESRSQLPSSNSITSTSQWRVSLAITMTTKAIQWLQPL